MNDCSSLLILELGLDDLHLGKGHLVTPYSTGIARQPGEGLMACDSVIRISSKVMKRSDLQSMSVEALWKLHESVTEILAAKIQAEKRELEKRLRQISQPPRLLKSDEAPVKVPRRPYPKVLPKYRNPLDPYETWSGEEKCPDGLALNCKRAKISAISRLARKSSDALKPVQRWCPSVLVCPGRPGTAAVRADRRSPGSYRDSRCSSTEPAEITHLAHHQGP